MKTPGIQGLLLAAGRGTRFGGDKLSHPLGNATPIAVAAARRLLSVLPNSLAVVRKEGSLARMLRGTGMRVLICADAERGMGHSLAAGVAATPAQGWLIALADMPFIRHPSYTAVIQALRDGAPLAAPVYRGQRGHPVGIDRRFQEALINLQGDYGARDILKTHAADLRRIEVDDPGVITDIDEPAQLADID